MIINQPSLITSWWCNVPILKNDGASSSMGRMASFFMKWTIKHLWNHQPDYHCIYIYIYTRPQRKPLLWVRAKKWYIKLTNGYMSYIPDDIIIYIYIYGIKISTCLHYQRFIKGWLHWPRSPRQLNTVSGVQLRHCYPAIAVGCVMAIK